MTANQLFRSDLKRMVAEVICIEELSKMLVKAVHEGDSNKAERFIGDIQKTHNELKRKQAEIFRCYEDYGTVSISY